MVNIVFWLIEKTVYIVNTVMSVLVNLTSVPDDVQTHFRDVSRARSISRHGSTKPGASPFDSIVSRSLK